MHEVERVSWTPDQRDLLRRIEAHPFERADHALDFTQRLARDRGWSLGFARGAVAEYRRFCFLAMVFDTPVTPSEEVDEVWHQHLTYSRDYWEVWCGNVLRQPLHHDPTAGGPSEQGRYRMQYAETLARYETFFGPPDPRFWPATHRRFRSRPRYRIVDGDRAWTLRRPALPGWFGRAATAIGLAFAGIGATPQPAAALPLNPLDWTAQPFLTLQAALAAAAVIAALVVRAALRQGQSRPFDLDLVELAYLAGGQERAADTAIVGLIDAGVASFSPASGLITVENRAAPLSAPLEPFRPLAEGTVKRADALDDLAPQLDRIRKKLIDAGLIPSTETILRIARVTLICVAPVQLLGIVKVYVGHARDKPVGFLILLIFATFIAVGIILSARPTSTAAGARLLRDYRNRYQRAARAPRQSELLFAYALGGAALLSGTAYDAYARHAQASNGGGSDGSSGGDGSGCGGGCGGCGGGGGD